MPANLLRDNVEGQPIGLNLYAVEEWIHKTTPFHADLQPYLLVHFRAKATFLEELSRQATNWQIIIWTTDVIRALGYIEKLIDTILEADETMYSCDLRNHIVGEICPNRRNLSLPDPEDKKSGRTAGKTTANVRSR